MTHSAEPPDELLQCFDDEGKPTEVRSRSEVKLTPRKYWSGISNIWVVNKKGQLLCSKRSLGSSGNPGKWQTYFGGHVSASLNFLDNAIKELQEEVGLSVDEGSMRLIKKGRDDKHKNFFQVMQPFLMEI